MKLEFDPNQQYQLDAISEVRDLFHGQSQGVHEYSVIHVGDMGGLFAGQSRNELGVGNHHLPAEEKLLANTAKGALSHSSLSNGEPTINLGGGWGRKGLGGF